MPHAGGGGSHSSGHHSSSGSSRSFGGGSHSSGFHSSSHSSSSSSSRGFSSGFHVSSFHSSSFSHSSPTPPRPRVTRSARPDTRKFVYYRDQKPRYLYVDRPARGQGRKLKVLWIWIPIILLFLSAYNDLYGTPSRLAKVQNHSVVIEDNIGVIDDEARLGKALTDFYETTGIVPAVITEYNSAWDRHYADLENQAYDLYVNRFSDEAHWLVVYSQPEHPDADFVDWYWQNMVGDATDSILTEQALDDFGTRLQKYLTAGSRYTVGEAFCLAFEETTPVIMAGGSNAPLEKKLVSALFILGLVLAALLHSRLLRFRAKRPAEIPADAVEVTKSVPEVTCAYCSGIYLANLSSCPHCGAAKQKQ